MEIKTQLEAFKTHVIEESKNPKFLHHQWYIKYHLLIVEQISKELCEIYAKADKDLVMLLVWLHDYGKVLGFASDYDATVTQGKQKLEELGFPSEMISKALEYVSVIDKKVEIEKAAIEVQIISSADGAAHFVGPFFPIWFYEYHEEGIEELMEGNIKKLMKDWEKKITLPEVKDKFKSRLDFLLEQNGVLPGKYF